MVTCFLVVTLDLAATLIDRAGAGGGDGPTLETNLAGEGDAPCSDLAGEGEVESLEGGRHTVGGAGEASLGIKRTGAGDTDLMGEGEGDISLRGGLTGDCEGLLCCHTGAGETALDMILTGEGDTPFWGLTGEGDTLLGCHTGADTCVMTRAGEGEAILGACWGSGEGSLEGFGGTDGGNLRAGDALK